VLTIERSDDARPLAQALAAGGLTVLEITLRTEAALGAIEEAAKLDGVVVGAGTVTSGADLARAAQAGATFAVSPGLTPALAEAARRDGTLPLLPGVATASEAMRARELGFGALKFFPAEPAGGAPALKSLAGPLPDLRFCPTGGVTESNAVAYLALPNVICVGGSWLAPRDDVAAGRWERITARAAAASALSRSCK